MINRVLVTLDGSELSEAVLELARDLCESTDAYIMLLRVAQAPNGGDVDGGYGNAADAAGTVATQTRETVDQKIVRVEDEVQTYLQNKAQVLGGPSDRVETEVLFSDKVADSIVGYAKGMDADVILMSTHGRTGLPEHHARQHRPEGAKGVAQAGDDGLPGRSALMRPTSACQFCAGDLVTVDGVLGPQLFCRACRRFQGTPETTYAEPEVKDGKQATTRSR